MSAATRRSRARIAAAVAAVLGMGIIATLALGAVWTPGPPSVPVPGRLFAANSVWNKPLSDSAPLDARNDALMGAFRLQVQREISGRFGPYIATTSYSTPIYRVKAGQPKVPVQLDTGPWGALLERTLAAGVPIPAGAQPAVGSDGHLTVWQPSTDTLWEFWRARRASDGWHASWGGVMREVSRNPGHYRDVRRHGRRVEQAGWGSTASSLPVAAGVVTVAEARRGRIDHALALNVPTACANVYSEPAQRTDGTSLLPDCIPEGAHLRLDPSLDLDAMDLPRFTRMLAEAAQRYGMIVRDVTGEATAFFCETPPAGEPTVWSGSTGRNGLLGGLPWELVRDAFPWDAVQLLPMRLRRR